jgi:hypothetical protein
LDVEMWKDVEMWGIKKEFFFLLIPTSPSPHIPLGV